MCVFLNCTLPAMIVLLVYWLSTCLTQWHHMLGVTCHMVSNFLDIPLSGVHLARSEYHRHRLVGGMFALPNGITWQYGAIGGRYQVRYLSHAGRYQVRYLSHVGHYQVRYLSHAGRSPCPL